MLDELTNSLQMLEKDMAMQTLQSSVRQYETAYNQSAEQYAKLQEHYQQALAGSLDPEQVKNRVAGIM